MNVFISYSNRDLSFVERLIRDLESRVHREIDLFYDKSIRAGESWAESLNQALAQANIILLVVSPDYLVSPWAQKETQIALWRASLDDEFRIIPLITRPCSLPKELGIFQSVDFTGDYNAALELVVWGITGTRPAAAEGPSPGDTKPIDPIELRHLRDELRQAIEQFRSRPAETEKDQAKPTQAPGEIKKCFIVMPFGDPDLEVVYEDFVKPVIERECKLDCIRGDDVFGSNVIMNDIVSSIHEADVVLADLTRKNANVFYEIGICHAIQKRVLLLSQSIEYVPFDLRHRRVLLYDYSPRGCKKLERDLKDNLNAVLD